MTNNIKIPPTPSVCPRCNKPAKQEWWCLHCDKPYTNEHAMAFNYLSKKEIDGLSNILSIIKSIPFDFQDFWPKELENILDKKVTLSKETESIVINGLTIIDLLYAIKDTLSEQ